MRAERPAPGEELNTGDVVTPREAATLMLLRDGEEGLEVLMVQRNPTQRFMGGMWVFPGGAFRDGDADPLATAVRELEEEAGIQLEQPDAPAFSRWITPAELKIRFDTWFFVAAAPEGAQVRIDGNECVDARWLGPAVALAACERGELELPFPTYKHLEQLQAHDSAAAVLEAARGRTVEPVQPSLSGTPEAPEVLLPDDPGHQA
ncbi:MAG TPA: NUDIX domain-containing protein [Thermoleophilaceae bacterium]